MRPIRSLLHPDDLARLVEREYEVEAPVSARLLSSRFNDTYRITDRDGSIRVLRVYARDKHWVRSDSDLLFELELLEKLAAAGLPVSHPYRRRGPGDALLGRLDAPEGERRFALFTFAHGASANDRPLSIGQLSRFGAEVAKLHAAMDAFRSDHGRYHLDQSVLVDMPLAAIGRYATAEQEASYAKLCQLAQRLADYVSALELAAPAYGLLHGDIHDGNLNVASNGEFVLLDFDLCGFGWRAYELSNYYRGPDDPKGERANWTALLDGYETVRVLSQSERDALPIFAACRGLWDIGDLLRDAHMFGDAWASETVCKKALERVSAPLAQLDW